MTGVSDVDVVYLYVADAERSLAFYRDELGIPLEQDEHDSDWFEARLPSGVRFALHVAHEARQPQPGTLEISFRAEDLEGTVKRVREAGFEAGPVRREFWGDLCEVTDPDGYRIGLFRPPSSD
jgi:catechol 2,3-dioxygenase-like lactoylglutathione lyase family enzyme